MSAYPVGYESDFVEERNRLTTFFRYLVAIPVELLIYVYGIGVLFSWIASWFALMFTGRYPEGLYRFNSRAIRWFTRVNGYATLLTDVYPPFDLDEHPEYPIRVPFGPAKERYSRLRVFFRGLLTIIPGLISAALGLIAFFALVVSWFVIVFTGKQKEGLQNTINMSLAYQARYWAYALYLTETWPPFSTDEDAQTPAPAPPTPEAPPTS